MKKKVVDWFTNTIEQKLKGSNLHTLLIAVAIIMIWRGIWGVLDLYLFPNYPLLSYVLGALVGILIIYLDDKRLDELDHK